MHFFQNINMEETYVYNLWSEHTILKKYSIQNFVTS